MFDALWFLEDKFKSPDNLVSFVTAYGMKPPNKEAAVKWFARGSIPSGWLPLLISLLEIENGSPPSLAKYIKGRAYDGAIT